MRAQDEEEDTETGVVVVRREDEPQPSLAGLSKKSSGLVHRSHVVSATAASAAVTVTDTWHDNQSSAATIHNSTVDDIAARARYRRQSFLDDVDLDPIILPKSTHTLLFTEPINSAPFVLSVLIAALSILCLLLALFNTGLTKEGIKAVIPANVSTAVKTAQYTSIFIALLMEEEIPTGLYLLKRISRQRFISTFPELNYHQFVFSNVLRILMGYLFLINVLLILMIADDVMIIFFDFIALQFIQQLDDVAFSLARMSMLSTSVQEATTRRYFRTEFRRSQPGRSRKRYFFIIFYVVNLFLLLSGMVFVSVNQGNGEYQCKSITAKFREDIWREATVKVSEDEEEYEERVLMYSYFDGIYVQNGTMHDGRPVYFERQKLDGEEFDTTLPSFNPEGWPIKIPAKIQYCESIKAWVFMHENIRKSKHDDPDCPWLLRSQDTEVYDIEEVEGPWQVWQGVIDTTNVGIACNECGGKADCNLHGICKKNGECECSDNDEGQVFLGSHCEVILKDNCRTIVGERYNESYTVLEIDPDSGLLWEAYNRPVFVYNNGSGNPELDGFNRSLYLMFSGSRWFGIPDDQYAERFTDTVYAESGEYFIKNYHAFWDITKYNDLAYLVSDPVTATEFTPVGVDFFEIKERGEQFGPFGATYPYQLYNQTGRGYFRCSDLAPLLNPSTSSNAIRHLGEKVKMRV